MAKKKKSGFMKWAAFTLAATAVAAGALYYTHKRPDTEYEEFEAEIPSKRNTKIPATIILPKTTRPMPLVLFVHGFGAERSEGNRFFEIAYNLAKKGIASICMDFAGCGASKEGYEFYCIHNNLDDMVSCQKYMTDRYPIDTEHIGVVGYSMGGRQTVLYTELNPDIRTIVLFAPAISKGFNHMEEFKGGRAAIERMKKEAEEKGYALFIDPFGGEKKLGHSYFMDMENMDVYKALENYHHNLLYIQGNKDITVTPQLASEALEHLNPEVKLNYFFMDHADHGFGLWDNHPEQSKKLVEITTDYLLRYL